MKSLGEMIREDMKKLDAINKKNESLPVDDDGIEIFDADRFDSDAEDLKYASNLMKERRRDDE